MASTIRARKSQAIREDFQVWCSCWFAQVWKDREVHCGPCQMGKQVKSKHSFVTEVQTSRTLELLHIGLMGPAKFRV